MKQFLFDQHGITVSESTISRALKKETWSRKAVRRRACERSDELRAIWRGRAMTWTQDQLVFIDESACNEHTMHRKYGWAPIGLESETFSSIKRTERYSVLPALDVNGYIACQVHQGSVTSDIFNCFIRDQVLPQCQPFPGPRSIIILDNASIHRNQELKDMCEEAGVLLRFLPPYSPDFNPIESTFKDLKTWLKKHYVVAELFNEFEDFLAFAIQQCCFNRDMRNHFRHCGYVDI
jgi:transposase InsO family protein